MSIMVEISNPANLQRVKTLLGARTDEEGVDMALEKIIEVYEPAPKNVPSGGDLPDEYWEDLFSDPPIPSSVIDKAIREEREDRF
jgi:hypothetical protein